MHSHLVEALGHEHCILVDQIRIAIALDQQVAVERTAVNGTAGCKGGRESVLGAELAQQRQRGGHLRNGGRMHRLVSGLGQQRRAIRRLNIDTLPRPHY